jgi:peptide/nickel transport system ATP-binding protein
MRSSTRGCGTEVALLEVRDLHVDFHTGDGVVRAVDSASFSVDRGQAIGIVGESGSGKSVTALTILGLTRFPNTTTAGSILFDGIDLVRADDEELRDVRGRRIAMIFQDPMSSLHPLYKVGWQIAEAIRAHEDVSRRVARRRAREALREIGIPSPEERMSSYPHELSGGMRQRVMIAMALALSPDVLIADEPTTALDVTVQAQILELIRRLRTERGTAVILITHDLGVVAELVDEIAVMYAGRVVEHGSLQAVLEQPTHPYTWGLLQSVPRLDAPRLGRLRPIAGLPPSLIHVPSGCPFHPRCPYAFDRCPREVPFLSETDPVHEDACLLPAAEKRAIGRAVAAEPDEPRAVSA